MKNLIELAEVATDAEQVFFPNRYQDKFIEAFQSLTGVEVPLMVGRESKAKSQGRTFWWLRGRDIPKLVQTASVTTPEITTVGLTGSEWCAEFRAAAKCDTTVRWDRLSNEKIGRVALIARADSNVDLIRDRLERGFEPVRVVTGYPNFVQALGVSGQCNIFPQISVEGGVEGAAEVLRMPAVDLVCRGDTIAINNFVVVEELLDTYPLLVTSSSENRGDA